MEVRVREGREEYTLIKNAEEWDKYIRGLDEYKTYHYNVPTSYPCLVAHQYDAPSGTAWVSYRHFIFEVSDAIRLLEESEEMQCGQV